MGSSPASDNPSPTTRGRLRRWGLRLLATVTVLVLAAGGLLVGFRVLRPGTLPNLYVDGVRVGNLDDEALAAALADLRRERGSWRLTVNHGPGAWVQAPAARIGYRLKAQATRGVLRRRGRQPNPLEALGDHLYATFDRLDVQPVQRVDGDRLAAWVRRAAGRLRRAPREGTVRFVAGRVVRVPPRPGAEVDEPALRAEVRHALLRGGPDELRAPTTVVPAATTRADIDALVERARRAVSAPVVLRRRDTEVTLTPPQLGRVLRVGRVEGPGDDVRLTLRADPRRLERTVGASAVAALRRRPVPATLAVRGRRVRVVPGSNGFRFVPRRAAAQVVTLATTPGSRRASLRGEVVQPERTTADLRDLGIRRRISTFTTYHDCCESRVANIHRIADIVDGAIVEPGEELELNAYVGPRTTENGFVSAPAILEGEFIEDVGGGVSQFATTFYNAAFFGGYELVEYKAHSYYISRYPMGREATIDYPYVDLRIRNNSPHGLLVKTSYTDTSITVSFYGRKWVDVGTSTGEPYNVVSGDISDGFDVTVTRTLRYRRGGTEQESYFTRYLPENSDALG